MENKISEIENRLEESDLAPISKHDEKRAVRDWPGMVIGAALRFRIEKNLSYAQNPKEVELPSDDWFRNDDPPEFRDEVRKRIIKDMEKAKPHLVQILGQTVKNIHTGVKESPNVNDVQEMLGKDAFRLARQLNWYVGLLKGKLPERVTPEFLSKIADTAKNVAFVLKTWITDEREIATIENAIRAFASQGVVDEETWESIKDLTDQQFVISLFKKLGVHIGIQPLNPEELDLIHHEDMKNVARYMLGFSGGNVLDKEELNKPSKFIHVKQRIRTLGTVKPLVYIAADKGLFPDKSTEEQIELMNGLQDATKGQYFGTLGVVQAFDLAQRSAILKPSGVAERIGATPIRLVCQDNYAGGQVFVDIAYDRSKGHEKRKLLRPKDKAFKASKGVGIAWGEEFTIDE